MHDADREAHREERGRPPSASRRVVDSAAIERLAEAASRVLRSDPGVIAAYLYGSAARGEPAADLDIALLTNRAGPATRALEELAALLQTEGAPTGPDLDVRLLVGSAPRFRANVVREGLLLYEADLEARLAFEAQTMSEWLDFKPVWERMRRRMFERWARG